MSEFAQHELYDLLNRNRPLWLFGIDLSNATLSARHICKERSWALRI
jgi:hypothetical protein